MWPLATMQGVTKLARDAGVALDMDGARLNLAIGESPRPQWAHTRANGAAHCSRIWRRAAVFLLASWIRDTQ